MGCCCSRALCLEWRLYKICGCLKQNGDDTKPFSKDRKNSEPSNDGVRNDVFQENDLPNATTAPLPHQQFGVSLQYTKQHNDNKVIPPVVSKTVEYIRRNGLETEGIFRISAKVEDLKATQKRFDEGENVEFEALDINIPASLLKRFLLELPEPLLTFDLYDKLIKLIKEPPKDEGEKLDEMRRILHDELPEDNYLVLKYVIYFLTEVESHAADNKMTSDNLAIVFGPNLMWSKSQASLASMSYVNACAKYLIDNAQTLFTK